MENTPRGEEDLWIQLHYELGGIKMRGLFFGEKETKKG